MIAATGEPLALTAGTSLIATVSAMRNKSPKHTGRDHRCHDRARDAAERILGLLGQVRRGVEADQRGQAHDHRGHQPAADGEVVRRLLR